MLKMAMTSARCFKVSSELQVKSVHYPLLPVKHVVGTDSRGESIYNKGRINYSCDLYMYEEGHGGEDIENIPGHTLTSAAILTVSKLISCLTYFFFNNFFLSPSHAVEFQIFFADVNSSIGF